MRKLLRLAPYAILFQVSTCSWSGTYIGDDGYVTASFNEPGAAGGAATGGYNPGGANYTGPGITTPLTGMIPPFGTPFVQQPAARAPVAGGGTRP
jgi:hypothetical protein